MKRRWSWVTVLVAATSLFLAGCSGGSISGGSPAPTPDTTAGSAAGTKVTVGLFPSGAIAALELGKQKGFFTKHGLDVEFQLGQGSSAQLPAVSSGTMDFMIASPTTPLVAVTRGLDVKIVSGYTQNNPDAIDDSTVVVAKDPAITRASDLTGKRVAVNALGSVGEIGIRAAVDKDGGDSTTIKFVQLGFNDVAAQLDAGQIDAGMTVVPFIRQITDDGGRVVSDFIEETELGKAELVIVGGGALLKDRPQVAEAFVAALDEALPYANEHPDEVRALLPELLGTPEDVASKIVFMNWSTALDEPSITRFSDLMVKYGLVEAGPKLEDVLWRR